MKKYEIVYLLDPTIEETETETKFADLRKLMEAQGAEILADETLEWGKRKLAYPIKKKEHATYRIYRFNAEPEAIGEIERRLRIDEQIMRSMIVLYDPDTEAPVKPAAENEE